MNVSALQQSVLFQKIAAQFEGDFCLDEPTRKIYATDASVYQEIPKAVAIPKSEADIELVIQLANQTGIGIIPRTAGTSLAGQVVGGGIVLDLSRHFTKILEINSIEKWVRVQPGVIRNELNAALEAFDLVFGPETSTGNRAMMGGMLGNNSCGSNSIVYGSIRDHTLEVTGFLSDGSLATFGELPAAELTRFSNNPTTLEQSIYAGLHEIFSSESNRQEIHRGFPKATVSRRNTGYALDAMVACQPYNPSGPPFNLCKLIAGSEGTLFLATEIKLRCHTLPPTVAGLLCVHFKTVDQALRASLVAMRYSPFACELIDRLILEGAARNISQRKNLGFVSGDPGAILVIEIRANHQAEVLETASQIQSELESNNLGYHFPVLFEPETKKVWELRKAGLGVVSNVPGDAKPCTVIEDTAVALEDLPAYISEMHQLLSGKYGLDCVHYAHAGAGEIHLRPVLNLKTESGRKLFRQVATDVASLVKKLNVSLSGEHGY